MDYTDLPYIVEPMKLRDIREVMEIERVSFPSPWSASAYRHELQSNALSHYFVARPRACQGDDERSPSKRKGEALPTLGERSSKGEEQPIESLAYSPRASVPLNLISRIRRRRTGPATIVGYGGFWLMAGEAHISTIAVRPELRRRGIGELLLVAMIDRATDLGAKVATLEVRVSNTAAQSLYRKYGFRQVGLRHRYYSNNEDALIMTTDRLTSAHFQRHLQGLKIALREKLVRGFAPPTSDLDGIGDHRARGRG